VYGKELVEKIKKSGGNKFEWNKDQSDVNGSMRK
jgi:hypothetical protein